ncbi:MAG: hypothetical protein O7B26_07000, partial [Planctomycetota bacterium]|nr:hypothetical protein [Planctomycetota bacterium]
SRQSPGSQIMLTIDTAFFLQIPSNSKKRILHPAKIVGFTNDLYTAELEETDLPLTAEQETLVFYESNRSFLQQAACVTDVIEGEPKCMFEFKTTGEPVSAESRQHYRVSAVMAGLTAQLGKEKECPLLDVSSTGFSVISEKTYEIGSIVDAVVRFDGKEHKGKVCIQGARQLSEGRIRYGLHCIKDSRQPSTSMSAGLQHISVSLQREQLRRLAGAR